MNHLVELLTLNELTNNLNLKCRSQFWKNDIRIWCRNSDSTNINRSGCWYSYPLGLCIWQRIAFDELVFKSLDTHRNLLLSTMFLSWHFTILICHVQENGKIDANYLKFHALIAFLTGYHQAIVLCSNVPACTMSGFGIINISTYCYWYSVYIYYCCYHNFLRTDDIHKLFY